MSQQNDTRCYTAVLYNTLLNCFLRLSNLNTKLLNPNPCLCTELWHKVILLQDLLMVCTSIQTISLTLDQKTSWPGYFKTFCPRNAFKRHMFGVRGQQNIHEQNPTVHNFDIIPRGKVCLQGSWTVSFDKINSFLPFLTWNFCRNAFPLGLHDLCTGNSEKQNNCRCGT